MYHNQDDNRIFAQIYDGTNIINLYSSVVGQSFENFKIALGYKSGNHALYINGVSVATSTSSTTVGSGLNQFALQKYTVFANEELGKVKATALWKTRLQNSELATLTTI